MDLRYGENPHQKAAMYSDGSGKGVANGRQLQGKELSTTTSSTCRRPGIWRRSSTNRCVAIIKHTNPCGTATGKTLQRLTSGRWSAIRFQHSAE